MRDSKMYAKWVQSMPKTFAAIITIAGATAFAAPTNLGPDSTPASTTLRTNLEKTPSKKGIIEAGWNMSLAGESFSNEKEQAQTAGLELGGKIRYGLLPQLEMKADAGLSLQSGYAQSRFGDNTPKNGLDLERSSSFNIKPLSRVTLFKLAQSTKLI